MSREQCCECGGQGQVELDDEWVECDWCDGKGWVDDGD
jgi:hypothetical protein